MIQTSPGSQWLCICICECIEGKVHRGMLAFSSEELRIKHPPWLQFRSPLISASPQPPAICHLIDRSAAERSGKENLNWNPQPNGKGREE